MNLKALFFAVTLLLVFTNSNAQTKQPPKKSSPSKSPMLSVLNGAWRSADGKGFTLIYDGFFNSVNQDSTGKWNTVDAGSYKICNDNTITLKTLYSSFPHHIGSLHTVDFKINNETLALKFFKKLIDAQSKDITAQEPKTEWVTMTKVKK